MPETNQEDRRAMVTSDSTKGVMPMSTQQSWVLISFILGLLFVTVSFAEGTAPKEDPRVAWLKQHAIPLRSIDPNDEDFTYLEPLAKVLGDVRIVQLGEQCHRDGATFHAKTRLIKFLHQKLGFDVLAFESGLYDCRKAWELLRGGMEPYEAFRHGVFGIWTGSEQIRPLIEYWGRATKGQRPLELCGFDCQFTGKSSRDLLVKDVNALWDKLGTAAPDAGQRAAIVEMLPKLADWHKPSQEERQQWDSTLAAWRKALETARPSDALPEADLAFWRQFVASTSTLAAICGLGLDPPEIQEWFKLRDPQMARNLVWLARTVYPQRKIIVWAATSHVQRNPLPEWGVRMGHEVFKMLGNQVYTIAFTCAEGEARPSWKNKAAIVEPPIPGSIEDLFVKAGCTNAFLNFHDLGTDGTWLKQKLTSRLLGHADWEANWTDMFDGIVFIKKMFVSTKRSKD